MLLYNVTFGIDKAIETEWILWMKTHYISSLMYTGLFVDYRMYKVLTHDDDTSVSYSVQCFANNIEDVLKSLAPLLDKVQNKISVTGHTDATAYGAGATYTNWELSADRANSARRALVQGGFPDGKVATVQGMGSAAPLVPDAPDAPINRRIAIIVLKKAVADALSNGGAGINSNDLLKTTDVAEPKPRIMTQKEVDAAIEAKR